MSIKGTAAEILHFCCEDFCSETVCAVTLLLSVMHLLLHQQYFVAEDAALC